MRSSLVCNTCALRSFQTFVQGTARPDRVAGAFAVRHASMTTRRIRNSPRAGNTETRIGQALLGGSITSPKALRHPSPRSEIPSPTSAYHTTDSPSFNNDLTSTRPAAIDFPGEPEREANGSIAWNNRISYYYHIGKAYLVFYKTGIKNIWYNYQEYRVLRKKLYGVNVHGVVRRGAEPHISRREFQLSLRTRHDVQKILPFGVIVMICGEFTPLVIIALGTGVVPYTCRIPKQIVKDLKQTLTRVEKVARMNPTRRALMGVEPALAHVHGLDPLGIVMRDIPFVSWTVWLWWVKRRFQRHMHNILTDSVLIAREGGARSLDKEELFQFCTKIGQVDTIKRLMAYYSDVDNADISKAELARIREEVQTFVDHVNQGMTEEMGDAANHPEAIFYSAAQHCKEVYLPPLKSVVRIED